MCITYKIRKSISVIDPKLGDLKNLGINGRMNLEETVCKGVDFNPFTSYLNALLVAFMRPQLVI
jgi:hypothetical protein